MPVQSDQAGPAIYQHLELAEHVPADNGVPRMAQFNERQAAQRTGNGGFQKRNFQVSIELRVLAGSSYSGGFVCATDRETQPFSESNVYGR